MYVSLFFFLTVILEKKKKDDTFQSVHNRNLKDSSGKKPVFSHSLFLVVAAVAVIIVVDPLHLFSLKVYEVRIPQPRDYFNHCGESFINGWHHHDSKRKG